MYFSNHVLSEALTWYDTWPTYMQVNGIISTGKEAIVYHAMGGRCVDHLASDREHAWLGMVRKE